jgi:Cft2 family RNA processing exonuclease
MKVQYEYLSSQTMLIQFPDFRILLDPEFGIDCNYDLVDVILVSTYKSAFICHIVEYCGFAGPVLMTGPTLELLLLYTQETTNRFTDHDLKELKRKTKPIYYQHVKKYMQIEIRALPAGTGIGFANWSIRYGSVHLVYSHCWTKPARKVTLMDVNTLIGCDVLFCTKNLELPKPIVNGKSWKNLWSDIYQQIKSKGNVIVVTDPLESMFDILETLARLIESSSIQHVPIHIVSPIAKHSISLMNIFSEWMNHERQQQTMTAQPWFLFDLLEKKQIICHTVAESVLLYPEPRIIVSTVTCMNSCLDLSHLYDGFLCLISDLYTLDVPVSQYPDCQFKLYKDRQDYISLEALHSFLRNLSPKYIIDSKIKGEVELDVSLHLTISNQVCRGLCRF